MRLLVTRPEPDGERTAEKLRARGHEVVVASVLRTEFIVAAFGRGPFAGVVLTSANAARSLADHPRRNELAGLPAFVVGAHTAEAARQAGLFKVVSADGAADDLAALLAERFAGMDTRLLYLTGEDRAGDLAARLVSFGIKVETAVMYRTVSADEFAARLSTALEPAAFDGVLHYSPRSADAFVAGAATAGLLEWVIAANHFCLSRNVAAALTRAGARIIRIAPHPDEASLLGLLNSA